MVGLKKASKTIARLERENSALMTANEQLRRAAEKNKEFEQYWRLATPLFKEPKHSISFIRKILASAHPDKHKEHKVAATAMTQTLTYLLTELRQEA